MARLPWSQRALACVLGITRVLAAIAILAVPFAVFLTGDTYTSVDVPVKSSGGVFGYTQCSNIAPGERDQVLPGLRERCEQTENVSMNRGHYSFASNDSLGRYYLAEIPTFIAAIVVFVVASLLLKVLQSVQEGDPFSRQNAQRLGRAALWSLIAFGAAVLHVIIPRLLVTTTEDFSFDLVPDVTPLVFAIVFAVLAEVFKRGAEMRDELETVV